MRTLESQSKEIGGVTYRVAPLTTKMALRVLARVLHMAAPAFGDVVSLRAAAKRATSVLGTLFAGLATDLDEKTLVEVCEIFADVSVVDLGGQKPLALRNGQWDEHFRGRFLDVFEWVHFAAMVTFGPLYESLTATAPEGETDEAPDPAG